MQSLRALSRAWVRASAYSIARPGSHRPSTPAHTPQYFLKDQVPTAAHSSPSFSSMAKAWQLSRGQSCAMQSAVTPVSAMTTPRQLARLQYQMQTRSFRSSASQQRYQISNASFLSSLPPEQVVYALIGVNVAVYGFWQINSLRGFMNTHFSTSYTHLRMGYFHTLLTSGVSQANLSHLFSNMFTLFFFGPHLAHGLGAARVCLPLFLPICMSSFVGPTPVRHCPL